MPTHMWMVIFEHARTRLAWLVGVDAAALIIARSSAPRLS